MKFINHIIFFGALSCASSPLQMMAQDRNTDTTFKAQSLNFYSTYKPEITPAPKPDFIPTLPKVDTSKPVLSYQVPEQTINYSYKAEPIKPLALKQEREPLPYENYAKLGIGTQNTWLLDAGIGSLIGDNYDAAVHFNHLSQKGNSALTENQKWSQNTLGASANLYGAKHNFNVGLELDRRAYRQYGYSNTLYSYLDEEIRNVYSGLVLDAGMSPVGSTLWDLQYQPKARFYMWNASMGSFENNIDLTVPVAKNFDSFFTLSLAVNAGVTSYRVKEVNDYSNNYFQLNPAVSFDLNETSIHAGIKPTFASSSTYVLPDIRLSSNSWRLAKLYAGWEGYLVQNSFRQLSLKNPFMSAQYLPKQGTENFLYGGFETNVGNNISFGATIGYKKWKNLAMFANDYALNPDGKAFTVLYEDVNAFVLDAKFQYQLNEQFSLQARSIWNGFSAKPLDFRALHMPGLCISSELNWQPISKLRLGAGLVFYDRIYALKANGQSSKINTIVDLNSSAEYEILKRLSFFGYAHNLLNQHYQYWNQYPSLGLSLSIGAKFKF